MKSRKDLELDSAIRAQESEHWESKKSCCACVRERARVCTITLIIWNLYHNRLDEPFTSRDEPSRDETGPSNQGGGKGREFKFKEGRYGRGRIG